MNIFNVNVFLGVSFVAKMAALVSMTGIRVASSTNVVPSLDITDFLKEEIKGPATFSCSSGFGCKFEEPGMNGLIETFFGDSYITLNCESGECLHYSQVPGYTVCTTLSPVPGC